MTNPQRRAATGATLLVRALQLEQAAQATPYQPTAIPNRDELSALRTASYRLPIFLTAWQGFLERPLFGWGTNHFERYFSTTSDININPTHAHNLVLQTLFERGLMGMLGLGFILATLTYGSLRLSSYSASLLVIVLVVNLFDFTFWTPGVIYPLAAVAGWLMGQHQARTVVSASRHYV